VHRAVKTENVSDRVLSAIFDVFSAL